MFRSPEASAIAVHPLSAAARTHDVGTGRQLSAPATDGARRQVPSTPRTTRQLLTSFIAPDRSREL